MRTSCIRTRARRAALAAVIAGVGSGALGVAGCGGSDPKAGHRAGAGPRLSAKDNAGVAGIGRDVTTYCFKGGAHANIERAVARLLVTYRTNPTARFRSDSGTDSTMRQVVAAVAAQLEACSEPAQARKLRDELRQAG